MCIIRYACGWAGRSVCMLLDDAELVGVAGDLGKQLGDPLAALAVLAELPGRAQQLRAVQPADRRGLAGVGRQLRLVVERVDVRRRPVHAQEDHPLRPGREVRRPGRQRRALAGAIGGRGERRQPGEGDVAEPGGDGLQERPARHDGLADSDMMR